jgi:chromosome segregation ATPase
MAEKAVPKKRTAAKQQMLSALADVQKEVEERREAELKPEQRITQRAVHKAVAVAEGLSLDSVVKSVSELKSSVSRLLTELGEKLEAEVNKYGEVRKAIEAKEKELADIFEIQNAASTLTALIETQQRLRDEFETQMARDKEELQREIDATRQEWAAEKKAGERNVLTTKIASLEQTVADQAKQLAAVSQKIEKAYAQVQEIAVRAIEGSANAKMIGNLQQLLSEQTRKGGAEK